MLKAPHNTRTSRVDEVAAARKPVVRWKPERPAAQATDAISEPDLAATRAR